jgi:vancomycin permeability regulator SanA
VTAEELTPEDVQRITPRFLALDAPPRQADLAFILRTRFAAPALLAAELFACGQVGCIVVTGGPNPRTGVNEAQAHHDLLIARGVPEDAIILETSSTYTLEYVSFALPLIHARIPRDQLRGVVAITKWYHARRAIMTLKHHLPAGVRYFAQSYEPEEIPRSGWQLSAASAEPVLHEWESIPRYLALGHIANIERVDGAFV